MASDLTRRRREMGNQLLAMVYQRPALMYAAVDGPTSAEHFEDPSQRQTWEAMRQVHSEGQEVNVATLVSKHVDPTFLAILDAAPAPATDRELRTAARSLAELYLQHTLHAQLVTLGNRATDADPGETAEHLGRLVEIVHATFAAGQRTPLQKHIHEYLDSIEGTARGEHKPIPTGMAGLDSVLFGGFFPGDFVTIGGMPGTGKTGLCLNFVRNQLEAGVHVGFIEGEMTRDEVFSILNAIFSGATTDAVRSGQQCAEINIPFAQWMSSKALEFVEVHEAQKNLRALTGIIESFARIGCGVVYIDFLQIFRVRGNGKVTEYEGVSQIVSSLRSLAMRLRICIVAIASNNRDSYDGQNRPTLHSFRGSGEIEYNSTRAIQLHRTTNDLQEVGGDRGIELMLLKNRSGRTGVLTLNFHLPTQRMREAGHSSARTAKPYPAAGREDEATI